MALIDDVNAALAQLGTDLNALISAESAKITELIAQITAGTPATTAQLQSIKDGLTSLDSEVTKATGSIPTTP